MPHSLHNAWANILTCHCMANLHTGPLAPIYPPLPLPGSFQRRISKRYVGSSRNYFSCQFFLQFMGRSCSSQGASVTLKLPLFISEWSLGESTGQIHCAKTRATVCLQSQSPRIRSHQRLQQCAPDQCRSAASIRRVQLLWKVWSNTIWTWLEWVLNFVQCLVLSVVINIDVIIIKIKKECKDSTRKNKKTDRSW